MRRRFQQRGSVSYRLVDQFLEWEYYGRDVNVTMAELASLVKEERYDIRSAIYRAMYRLREEGLVRVIVTYGAPPSRWVIPADFGDRYERWVEGEKLPPEPIQYVQVQKESLRARDWMLDRRRRS